MTIIIILYLPSSLHFFSPTPHLLHFLVLQTTPSFQAYPSTRIQTPMPSSSSFLFLFLCFFFLPSAPSDPRAQRAALLCTNRTVLSLSRRQVFIANFLAAMDALTPLTTSHGHGAVSNGSQNATVYAFGECMRDLSRNDCNLCLAQCKTQLLACLPFQRGTRGGRLFFDGCYLRFCFFMDKC